ncbi:transcriptional regulator [Streptococcus suis]|uniref:hypothetical protein n=1 Tax=Streptococcus TaxID=1301 RepID=UPI0004135271|nr:hypothetical protein [Streptococcus suis]MBS8079696.1 transcriptional regulator [Streptococcus suis]MCK3965722.1 transcriptional regulator [Streptococcus suis]MCK3974343.1 transcriptional regulator [Streptococcus suis]NQK32251.1 transcriptional regulator [Streptococcus suis]NQK39282.1 transcriptional regulator [Streptococcus suis]
MAELFWENLALLLAEKEMSWAELTRQMFAGSYQYPSEFNRLYQKIRHYKSTCQMPQTKWVEKIVLVLEVDYEDLFRR